MSRPDLASGPNRRLKLIPSMIKINSLFASFALAALLPFVCSAQTPAGPQAAAVSHASFFARGLEAFDAGRFEEALENFLRAVQANPEDAEAVFDAGLAYERLGRFLEASAAYRHAAELRPSYKKAHAHLCSALVASESFQEAIEACGQAVRLDQKDAGLYYQYGRAFAGAGLFDLAVDAFTLSARLSPGDAEVRLRLGLAYHSLGEFRDALDSLERAARLAPDSQEARAAYERVAAEIDGLDRELGSVQSYEKLLSLGDAFRLKGQYARAIAVYKRASRLKPEDPRGYYLE